MNKKNDRNYKDYLDKTFLEELNFKIWTTYGSRFNANKRLLLISRLSNLTNSILFVYLIAIGLLSVYNIYGSKYLAENVLPYLVTCLSILLFVFSQIEYSRHYHLNAREFKKCGIELSRLYNRLRIFKTLNNSADDKQKESFADKISNEYEDILEKYDNHEPIDFLLFKTRHRKYFGLSKFDVFSIKIGYYFKIQFIYHLMIILPLIIFTYIIIS